jgi:RNA polymerase sigma-70 factor (ECF subfamily)
MPRPDPAIPAPTVPEFSSGLGSDLGAAAEFNRFRPRLVRIAYRMLGSIAEAEDMVQEAWLRWHQSERTAVRDPKAYLARIVARLCLDHLKSARVRRESYIGPWLPDPVIEPEVEAPGGLLADDRDDLTLTLMMALERLSPLERAAFLLHDVFDIGFDEIAEAIDRDPATCRQLASRARAHVRAARPRYPLSAEKGKAFAVAFFAATRSGDMQVLQNMLAEDVVLYADGGGKITAVMNPVLGRDKVARLFAGLARKPATQPMILLQQVTIDGLPGFISMDPKGVLQTTAIAVEDGKIIAIYTQRNPDKLKHVKATPS